MPVAFLLALLIVGVEQAGAADFSAGNPSDLINSMNTAKGNGEADTITITSDIVLSTQLSQITSEIIIQRNDNTIARDTSASLFSTFYVDRTGSNNGNLTLENVTVKDADCRFICRRRQWDC